MIISFVGHSKISVSAELEKHLTHTILSLLPKHEKITFYCGGYGDFDTLCAHICHTIASSREFCEVLLVTPYITESQQKKLKELQRSNLYDGTIYPPLENVPLRFAISRRNEWMILQSDLVIAFVSHSFGGAYKTLAFAHRKKKRVINLAESIHQAEEREESD